jgi:predicted AAA+ superfamily ATPase
MITYTRLLDPPKRSFFLFGPRATGKSTWLRHHFADARFFDLLDTKLRLALLRDPALLPKAVAVEPRRRWIVIDEVQLVPDILHEVHRLMERDGRRFAMSGSSARKLRRGQANLMAGRAVVRSLFPLTFAEYGDPDRAQEAAAWGTLPLVFDAGEDRADVLEAYALTYLKEEIQAEALVRDLGAFSRFLECAALANAQVTNLSTLARDAGVKRPTVQGYFEVLIDTLLGSFLPSFRPRARVKETAHPKFYWFDSGVARAMAGRVRAPVDRAEHGKLLETYLHHELRAHLSYGHLGGELSYWRTADGVEVDFVWSSGRERVGIEVKASPRWRTADGFGLQSLHTAIRLTKRFAVYLGGEPLHDEGITVLPLATFLQELSQGHVLR